MQGHLYLPSRLCRGGRHYDWTDKNTGSYAHASSVRRVTAGGRGVTACPGRRRRDGTPAPGEQKVAACWLVIIDKPNAWDAWSASSVQSGIEPGAPIAAATRSESLVPGASDAS